MHRAQKPSQLWQTHGTLPVESCCSSSLKVPLTTAIQSAQSESNTTWSTAASPAYLLLLVVGADADSVVPEIQVPAALHKCAVGSLSPANVRLIVLCCVVLEFTYTSVRPQQQHLSKHTTEFHNY